MRPPVFFSSLLPLSLGLIAGPCLGQSEGAASSALSGDFRQATWGMSKAEVLEAEANAPRGVREQDGEEIVTFASKLAGIDASVVYIFAKDQLVRAKYFLTTEHVDPNDFIADYRSIEPLLKKCYGEPTETRAVWEEGSLQSEPIVYLDRDRATPLDILPSDLFVGLDVASGHLKLLSQWRDGRTEIMHALTGLNGKIVHQIEYVSTDLVALEDQVRPKSAEP